VSKKFDIDDFDYTKACKFIELFDRWLDLFCKLTPIDLIQIFPIQKIFDDKRWQNRNFVSTIEMLVKRGLNKPLGKKVLEILNDYLNPDIDDFCIIHTCVFDIIFTEVYFKNQTTH
jgi:hypothetical protein